MTTYTITYTEAEQLAMQHATADVNEWIQNAAHHRAMVAVEELVQLTVQQCLANSVPIPNSKEDMIRLAYAQGWTQAGGSQPPDPSAVDSQGN